MHFSIFSCFSGGRNEGLARQLGISVELPWSINPFDESREVFWTYDFNHIFKNMRNAFLDNITILKDGTRFSKQDVIELFDLVKKS